MSISIPLSIQKLRDLCAELTRLEAEQNALETVSKTAVEAVKMMCQYGFISKDNEGLAAVAIINGCNAKLAENAARIGQILSSTGCLVEQPITGDSLVRADEAVKALEAVLNED